MTLPPSDDSLGRAPAAPERRPSQPPRVAVRFISQEGHRWDVTDYQMMVEGRPVPVATGSPEATHRRFVEVEQGFDRRVYEFKPESSHALDPNLLQTQLYLAQRR